jgi:hypothetical protein
MNCILSQVGEVSDEPVSRLGYQSLIPNTGMYVFLCYILQTGCGAHVLYLTGAVGSHAVYEAVSVDCCALWGTVVTRKGEMAGSCFCRLLCAVGDCCYKEG